MANDIEKDYLNIDIDAKRLVDWQNPPSVVDLKKDLSEAMPSHSEHINKVNSWMNTLRGEFKGEVNKGRSKVQPKLVRKQNEWRYAALEEPFLSTDDMFKVNPVTHLDVEAARQNALIINKQFRIDIPRTQFVNKYIRTAVNTGSVIVKLSWEEETGNVREEHMEPVYLQNEQEAMAFFQAAIQNQEISEEEAMQAMQTGEWQEIVVDEYPVTEMVVKKYINRPVLEVKDTRSVIIDPSCEGDIEKARFVIDKFWTDLSSLKKDGRYDKDQLNKIQEREFDSRTIDDYNNEYRENHNFSFNDKPRKKLLVYEYWGYWDIHKDGIVVPIVATWVGDVMIRLEENPYPDKKPPFVVVQYLPPIDDTIYGDADASLLKDNQDIIGAVTRGMIDLIGRTANAQTGIRKDLLDPINLDRYKKGLDFEYNPVTNLDNAIYIAKMPEVPKSAYEMIQLENNDAEALSGVKAFSNGISGDALGSQVGGIRSALDATAKRELGILRRLANGFKQIAIKIIAMNSVWLNDEEIIRITDTQFVTIKRDDLAGQFDLVVDISTAEADNQKASELSFMLQTIGQSTPWEITKIILIKIAELRKMPDLAMSLREYDPQPDPLAIAMQEAQINLINAQAQKEFSAAPKNEADTRLKDAKAESEGAKSRKTHSDTDMVDLSYLQEATGLNQDRELEKIKLKEGAKLVQQQAKTALRPK